MRYPIEATFEGNTEEGTFLKVLIPDRDIAREVLKLTDSQGYLKGDIFLNDGRTISAEQRKKVFATIKDIASWNGDDPGQCRMLMKYWFIALKDQDDFSLRDCSMSIAREFITFLIDFVIENGVQLSEPLILRCDNIEAAIYASLYNKRCVICGNQESDLHHWNAIGMGRDRKSFDDGELRKIQLCRTHHDECHRIGRDTFEKKYHVYGVIYG